MTAIDIPKRALYKHDEIRGRAYASATQRSNVDVNNYKIINNIIAKRHWWWSALTEIMNKIAIKSTEKYMQIIMRRKHMILNYIEMH